MWYVMFDFKTKFEYYFPIEIASKCKGDSEITQDDLVNVSNQDISVGDPTDGLL